MSAVAHEQDFPEPAARDYPVTPLVELRGMWTTSLAEQYLPIPGATIAKYECVDGDLVMSPHVGTKNGYAAAQLIVTLSGPARAAGHGVSHDQCDPSPPAAGFSLT